MSLPQIDGREARAGRQLAPIGSFPTTFSLAAGVRVAGRFEVIFNYSVIHRTATWRSRATQVISVGRHSANKPPARIGRPCQAAFDLSLL
jgi:hypothetical protein